MLKWKELNSRQRQEIMDKYSIVGQMEDFVKAVNNDEVVSVIVHVPIVPGEGFWRSVYSIDNTQLLDELHHSEMPNYKFVYSGVYEEEFGGGHTKDRAVYKVIKIGQSVPKRNNLRLVHENALY